MARKTPSNDNSFNTLLEEHIVKKKLKKSCKHELPRLQQILTRRQNIDFDFKNTAVESTHLFPGVQFIYESEDEWIFPTFCHEISTPVACSKIIQKIFLPVTHVSKVFTPQDHIDRHKVRSAARLTRCYLHLSCK